MTEQMPEHVRHEPLLIGSMRRAKADAEVRIVNGSGTTVRGFLAEFDEYVAERVAQAKAEVAPILEHVATDRAHAHCGHRAGAITLLSRPGHLSPTPDDTPEHGLTWRDGLDALNALLNDCSQAKPDHESFVRVSAVRDIVAAVQRYEDATDEDIRSALWEDAVVRGEEWTEEDRA